MTDLRIYPDRTSAARGLAALVGQVSRSAVAVRDRFTLVLSGGNSPREAYRLMSDEFADDVEWARASVFFSDERCVPHEHPDSNTKMARETLLDHVAVPFDRVYRIPTQLDPESAARAYEAELRRFFDTRGGIPRFDLVILGMGADGHTASLFPGSAALEETERWVVHTTTETAAVRDRISLTLPVLNAAAHVVMYILGEDKAETVAHIVSGADGGALPASRVNPPGGKLTWIIDEGAASRLHPANTIDLD